MHFVTAICSNCDKISKIWMTEFCLGLSDDPHATFECSNCGSEFRFELVEKSKEGDVQ